MRHLFGEPLVRETPCGELAEHAAESRLRRDETRTVPSAEPARQGFGAEHPHELLRVLDVQHGLEVDPGEESLVEFVPESADGTGA